MKNPLQVAACVWADGLMRNVESKRRFFSSWEKQKSCNFAQNISVCWGVRNLHPSVFSRGVNVKDTTPSTSEGTGAVKPVGSSLSDGYRFMFTCWTGEAGEENVTEHKLSTAAEETLESSTQLPGFPREPALTLRRLNQTVWSNPSWTCNLTFTFSAIQRTPFQFSALKLQLQVKSWFESFSTSTYLCSSFLHSEKRNNEATTQRNISLSKLQLSHYMH